MSTNHNARAQADVDDQGGWVLEKGPVESPVYLVVEQFMLSWERDLDKALRLARRQDAESLCQIVEDADRIRDLRLPPVR